MPRRANDTKNRIFLTALDLFANDSYHTVSMRDIARQVGIKPSSIYNHFSSKDELLTSIYTYFDEHMTNLMPDVADLMAMVGSVHPHEILMNTNFTYPPDIMETMAKTMLVTSSQMRADPRADELIMKNLINAPYTYDPPLLRKMAELELIEPLDVDHYTLVHSCYCHSAAVRFYHYHMINHGSFLEGLRMICSLARVRGDGLLHGEMREAM